MAKSRQKLKLKLKKKRSDFDGFQSPEVRENNNNKFPDFYIWLSFYSQKI
jgi:hypothetical protein